MASTNKTSNLELSQFIATDTPTWLVDYNGDMEKIDAGVGRVEELAQTASTQAVGVASGLQATNQNVTTLSGQVANVQNQANTTTASVNDINNRLGNADISGIGDGTITGAIKEQNSNSEGLILQPNVETKVGTLGGKNLYRKIITKDFHTSAIQGTIHEFDEVILPENIVSINALVIMVEEGAYNVLPNNKISINANTTGKLYSRFEEDWTTATYTWRYKLDILYTK